MIIYGIKSCDTVKKAKKYLEQHSVDFTYHDFRVDGLELSKLKHWEATLGWESLLNRRSTSWRQLSDEDKADINSDKAIALMAANSTLIKRPLLETDDDILVGFKETSYSSLVHK